MNMSISYLVVRRLIRKRKKLGRSSNIFLIFNRRTCKCFFCSSKATGYTEAGVKVSREYETSMNDEDLVCSYVLIEVSSEEEALQWALRMPVPNMSDGFSIEVRRLVEPPASEYDIHKSVMEDELKSQLDVYRS